MRRVWIVLGVTAAYTTAAVVAARALAKEVRTQVDGAPTSGDSGGAAHPLAS